MLWLREMYTGGLDSNHNIGNRTGKQMWSYTHPVYLNK